MIEEEAMHSPSGRKTTPARRGKKSPVRLCAVAHGGPPGATANVPDGHFDFHRLQVAVLRVRSERTDDKPENIPLSRLTITYIRICKPISDLRRHTWIR